MLYQQYAKVSQLYVHISPLLAYVVLQRDLHSRANSTGVRKHVARHDTRRYA